MFKSAGLAKMFAGRRKFFRGPHVRHLCSKRLLISCQHTVISLLQFKLQLLPATTDATCVASFNFLHHVCFIYCFSIKQNFAETTLIC